MRRVGLSDLDAAARAVMTQPQDEWPQTARTLVEAAHLADCFRKRTGRPHPSGGTGSLFAQAVLVGQCDVGFADAAYVLAMEAVLHALAEWRGRQRP